MRRAWVIAAALFAGCDLSSLEVYDGGVGASEDATTIQQDAQPKDADPGEDAAIDEDAEPNADAQEPDATEPDATEPAEETILTAENLNELTTTGAPVIAAELRIKARDENDVWLIFASGRLRPTPSMEAVLTLDGAPRDRFSHRGTDWAGFVSFMHLTGDTNEHEVTVELHTFDGEAAIDDVRIVAFKLPPNADFHAAGFEQEYTVTGVDFPLLALDIYPESAGDYYVFARAEQNVAPGLHAVQTRLFDELGEARPDAPSGVGYAGRGASSQPIFISTQSSLSGEARFELRGTSSGKASADDWWDPLYRSARPLEIIARDEEVWEGYEIFLIFDHAAMVSAGVSLSDGRDIRVVYDDGVSRWELPRAIDPDFGWNRSDTMIWFPVAADIPQFTTDAGYRVYFDNSAANTPFDDPKDVFHFYDDFSGPTFNSQEWIQALDPRIDAANGWAIVEEDARIFTTTPFHEGPGHMAEAKLAFDDVGSTHDAELFLLSENDGYDDSYAGFLRRSNAHVVGSSDGVTQGEIPVSLLDPANFHVYGISRDWSPMITYWRDTMPLQIESQLVPTLDFGVLFRSDTDVSLTVDWVRVREWVPHQPLLSFGAPVRYQGDEMSTWRNARIIAFRGDAFDDHNFHRARNLSTTTSPSLRVRNMFGKGGSDQPRKHLVIQSMRVSADTEDPNVRRSGVLQIDDQTVLETSHQIGADGSAFGYHHVAGFAGIVESRLPFTMANGFVSPDRALVESAESVIIVLTF